MNSGPTTRPLPTLKPQSKPQTKAESASVVTESEEKQPVRLPVQSGETIKIDLGFSDLVDLDVLGYLPSRPEVILTPKAREAVKRLALTLEQQEAVLSDGTQVRNSASKTIVWLCERLADSLAAE